MEEKSAPSSFQERQKELCLLSSYIEEREQWLSGLLERLGWSKESLEDRPTLVQCPVNGHHFVPRSSLEKHKQQCQYSALGIKMEDVEESLAGKAFYENRNIPCVEISSAVEKAIAKYARQKSGTQQNAPHASVGGPTQRDYIDQSDVIVESRDSLVTREHFASLQDSQPAPPEILAQHPTQIIRFVKSWSLMPQDFISIDMATIDKAGLKAWLFNHLPDQHAHSSVLGGEMQAVDLVLHWLGPSTVVGGTTPDALMGQLRALLGLKTRQFVLGLWKFLHISRLQQQHGIPASMVEELTPLPLVVRGGREPSVAEEIEALAKQEADDGSSHLPLPMCHAYYQLPPELRRITYDYVVAVGGRAAGGEKGEDPELYRDDEKMLKAKLKAQELGEGPGEEGGAKGKSQLELLKEQRDYKRRRQTYRAKNVHITRRTPAQVLGAIISGRMEEIRAAILQQQQQLSGDQPELQADQNQSQSDSRGDQDEGSIDSPVKPTDNSPFTQQDQRSGGSPPRHRWDRGRSKETHSEHGYRSHRRSRSRSIEGSSKQEKQKLSSSERVKSSEQQDRNKRGDSRERGKHKKSRKHSRSRSRDRHKKRRSRSRSRSRDRRRSRSRSRSRSKPSREKHKHK